VHEACGRGHGVAGQDEATLPRVITATSNWLVARGSQRGGSERRARLRKTKERTSDTTIEVSPIQLSVSPGERRTLFRG
jgi:hypothetical protein